MRSTTARPSVSVRRFSIMFNFFVLVAALSTVHAASRTWDGSSSGNWSVAANWVEGAVPASGDDLTFGQIGAINKNNTNNILGLNLRSITFADSGYTLNGNAVTITNAEGISANQPSGANTVNLAVTITVSAAFDCPTAGALLTVNGSITLGANTLTNSGSGHSTLAGLISGTGGLVKSGTGTNLLAGSVNNTYSGTTRVTGGTLELNDSLSANAMVPGDLIITSGKVFLTEGNQIADSANVTVSGQFSSLQLNNLNETIASLDVVNGGDVTTGTGTLTLGGDLTADPAVGNSASISGNLSLGAATRTISVSSDAIFSSGLIISAAISGNAGVGFIKTGGGTLQLGGANTYSGLTTVSNGLILATTATAFGTSAAGTTLNGGSVEIDGVTIANESLTNNSASSALEGAGGVASGWSSNIVLNADLDVLVFTNGTLNLSGLITGTGGITKSQPGILQLSSSADANDYNGDTIVNEGILELGGIRVIRNGTLVIGDGLGGVSADIVRYSANGPINNGVSVVINSSGLLDMNGFSDDLGLLTLDGGQITTGAGTMTMAANLTASRSTGTNNNPSISGNLLLGSTRTFNVTNGTLNVSASISGAGGIIKAGAGTMTLLAVNGYSGVTTVNAGTLNANDDRALGSTAGGTVVNGTAALILNNAHVTNEVLTLNSTNPNGALQDNSTADWAGNITLSTNVVIEASSTFGIEGIISGPGGFTLVGGSTLTLSGSGANTYSGTTMVNEGTLLLSKSALNGAIQGLLVIGDGVGGTNADVVQLGADSQIADTALIQVNSSGLLDLNGHFESTGAVDGSGQIDLGVSGDFRPGAGDGSSTFSGLIVGSGSLFKSGNGTWTLTGDNTYTGTTTVSAGTLVVDGSQPQCPVTVNGSATLKGNGIIGVLHAFGAVAPGSSPGILTSSNILFDALGDYFVEINGASPGAGYDQLNVRGTNNLGGSTLHVTVGGGFAPTVGQTFTILVNDGADLITGTFAGLPQGSIKTNGIHKFIVSYIGGTGANDVTLTYTNPPLIILNPEVSAGNGNLTIDPNECNNLNLVISNVLGAPLTGISAVLSSTTPGVVITQPESAYPNIGINGKGTNTTPFQISTLPTFNCSDTIDLSLTVTTTSGDFVTKSTVASGSPGAPVRFDNNTFTGIPDGGSVDSTNVVAGITTPVKKVSVSLYVTHQSVADLTMTLIAPDGTPVELSSNNGATGDDYGTDCADGSRTTFDDAAGTSITAGAAPFTNAFRPEGTLTTFVGKTGAEVNGPWILRIADGFAGTAGTLRCWSLFISPTACIDGDGSCARCEDTTIRGTITTNHLVQAGRLLRDGNSSTCAAPKSCPGLNDSANRHYDAYTFYTASNSCVTVTLTNACGNVFSETYLNSYDPMNLCTNYLADAGSTSPSNTYSFNVTAGSTFVVVVNEVTTNSGCANYELSVTGLQCGPPTLAIEPVPGNKVRLHWPTTAGGFVLNASDVLVPANFLPVTNEPIVFSGRYNVTNNVAPTNRFYRLIKP